MANNFDTYRVYGTPTTGGYTGPWNETNPNALIGMLEPPPSYHANQQVAVAEDASGNKISVNGYPLRRFRHVPNNIQVAIEDLDGVEVELWFRLHVEFQYKDIWSHLGYASVLDRENRNRVNMNRTRNARRDCNSLDWKYKGNVEQPPRTHLELIAALTPLQIAHNTSWVVTANGIHPPGKAHMLFPLNIYLANGQPHRPTGDVFKHALAWIHGPQDGEVANIPRYWMEPRLSPHYSLAVQRHAGGDGSQGLSNTKGKKGTQVVNGLVGSAARAAFARMVRRWPHLLDKGKKKDSTATQADDNEDAADVDGTVKQAPQTKKRARTKKRANNAGASVAPKNGHSAGNAGRSKGSNSVSDSGTGGTGGSKPSRRFGCSKGSKNSKGSSTSKSKLTSVETDEDEPDDDDRSDYNDGPARKKSKAISGRARATTSAGQSLRPRVAPANITLAEAANQQTLESAASSTNHGSGALSLLDLAVQDRRGAPSARLAAAPSNGGRGTTRTHVGAVARGPQSHEPSTFPTRIPSSLYDPVAAAAAPVIERYRPESHHGHSTEAVSNRNSEAVSLHPRLAERRTLNAQFDWQGYLGAEPLAEQPLFVGIALDAPANMRGNDSADNPLHHAYQIAADAAAKVPIPTPMPRLGLIPRPAVPEPVAPFVSPPSVGNTPWYASSERPLAPPEYNGPEYNGPEYNGADHWGELIGGNDEENEEFLSNAQSSHLRGRATNGERQKYEGHPDFPRLHTVPTEDLAALNLNRLRTWLLNGVETRHGTYLANGGLATERDRVDAAIRLWCWTRRSDNPAQAQMIARHMNWLAIWEHRNHRLQPDRQFTQEAAERNLRAMVQPGAVLPVQELYVRPLEFGTSLTVVAMEILNHNAEHGAPLDPEHVAWAAEALADEGEPALRTLFNSRS